MMKKIVLILMSFFTILLFFIGPTHADLVIPDRPSNGIYDPNHYLSEVVSDKLIELMVNRILKLVFILLRV